MRVALVSDWYYPKVGGVASHMHSLAIKLSERSHRVAVVTNDRRTGKEDKLEKLGIELLKIPGFVLPGLDLNLTHGFKVPNTLDDFLEDFDIIHSHHAFTPLALKALEAGRKTELSSSSQITAFRLHMIHISGNLLDSAFQFSDST